MKSFLKFAVYFTQNSLQTTRQSKTKSKLSNVFLEQKEVKPTKEAQAQVENAIDLVK